MSKRMVDLKVADGEILSINGYEVGGGTAVEANPQEEATQQLDKIKIDNISYNIAGGGSGSGFIVTDITTQAPSTGRKTDLAWVSGRELKANTEYAVGDQVQIKYFKTFGNWSVNPNSIAIPIAASNQVPYGNEKLTFGSVVLVCTNVLNSFTTTKTNDTFKVSVTNHLTYTVVKAGTTGTDLTVPTSIGNDEELIINFYNIQPVTA